MNLLLDIGNTNLRWALQRQGVLGEMRVLRHDGGVPLDLLADWEQLGAPARVLASNVGGAPVEAAIARVTRAYWGLEPELVSTRGVLGDIRIAYAQPERFGVDRWLALIAVYAEARRATLIVDAGTAVTLDLMLADGRHLGGLILPGIEMMRASLLAGTQIPKIDSEPVGDPWACDTGPAVAAGSLQAIAALADRVYDRFAEQAGTEPRMVLTGGDAERLRPVLEHTCDAIPDLVLRGLACVAGD